MKLFYQFALVCSLVLSSFLTASGQITITLSDVSAQLAPGHSITTKTDTSSPTANIGKLGATSWDFSSAVTNYTASSTTVSPDTTPYFSDFSSATNGTKAGAVYAYLKIGPNLEILGIGTSVPFTALIKNSPAQVALQLPLALGTSWTSSYAESTIIMLPPPTPPFVTVDERVVTNTVDAYGPLTLPGGAVTQALRIKIDTRTSDTRFIMYEILAKNGTTVEVSAADTVQPDTGTIAISSISWNGPIGTTAVEEIGGGDVPSRFALEQNYPNPFNPSTTFRFSVATDAFVTLKLYNLLGQELTTLVSGKFTPGTYSVPWNGSGFASGVYLYRLQAGPVTETRKLVLMQ